MYQEKDVPQRFPSSATYGLTQRLAAVSSRRPRRTLAIWGLVVLLALVLAGTSLKGLTTTSHVVGATQSTQAEALYNEVVGSGSHKATDVVVVSSKTSTASDQGFKVFVIRLEAKVGTSPGITDVVSNFGSGSPLVSDNRHAALISLRASTDADIIPVVHAVQSANGSHGFSVAVTGDHTLDNDFSTLATSDLRHRELDFGLPIAIVVLLLVFGAVVAGLMPVLMALVSILVGLGIATLVGEEFHLSTFIVNMMTAMGLALGIDYSLFVISRFREERAGGLDKEAAIQRTAATASRAVLFSGSTFVVALLGMFLVPTNTLRSLAAGAVIVGVVSVAAALTLLPAMLQLLGDRVNSLRLPIVGKHLGNMGSGESRIWRTFIEAVLRHRAVMLTLAVGLMVVIAVPLLGIHVGQSGVATLPNSLPSKQGYLAVQRYFPSQDPYPVEIVADGGDASTHRDLSKLEAVLAGDPRFGSGTVEASADGNVLALTVPIRGDVVSSPDVAAVRQLRSDLIPSVFNGSQAHVYVGGQTADTADYFSAVSAPTPYVLLFVLGLSFILLLLAFRSLVIALVSILLNLLSVGAAYGLLTLVFIRGVGAGFFGFHKVTAIDAWVPLFLFSVLFALSMDYQVFLMSRIKERYDETGSTTEAVVGGVASTAKIITGAALIIVVVFSGFARGQLDMFQQMGFGVAVALLLDATLIRSIVLPCTLSLLGERSWYLPRWFKWLPRIEVETPRPPTAPVTDDAERILVPAAVGGRPSPDIHTRLLSGAGLDD
jgi:putative drug exporter of the RND superfamily